MGVQDSSHARADKELPPSDQAKGQDIIEQTHYRYPLPELPVKGQAAPTGQQEQSRANPPENHPYQNQRHQRDRSQPHLNEPEAGTPQGRQAQQ